MTYVICALVVLRLFFWRIFPQYGTNFMSDMLFGMFCLTALALYNLSSVKKPLSLWLGTWVVAAALSFFTTQNYTVTFSSWFVLLVYVLLFCALQTVLKRSNDAAKTIWATIFLGAAFSSLLGIWEFVKFHYLPSPATHNMTRACSLQGWPTAFAGFLIMMIPTAWSAVQEHKKGYAWVVLLVLLLGLLSSMSVFAVVSLGVAFLLVSKTADVKRIVLSLGVLSLFACSPKTLDSFLAARVEYYSRAWEMITQHPLLGAGLGTFQSYGPSKSAFTHNSYIQLWAEGGPLGLIALLGVALSFWNMKPKEGDAFQQALFIGLLAVFIDNLFSFTILASSLSFVWWIGLAIYCHVWQKGKGNGLNRRD
jgi:hypothetical protein